MQFGLARPCKDCSFRSDITFYLQPARVVTILEGIFQDGETFTCHNAAYGRWHRGTYRPHQRDQHCAGALMLIRREDMSHRMTQIAERLGLYDPGKLDLSAPVFPTVEVMLERFEALELATALLAWLARVRPRPPQ